MRIVQNRRHFLAGAAAAGAASLLGPRARAGQPPETTTVRLGQSDGASCWASMYLAGELLRADGSHRQLTLATIPSSRPQAAPTRWAACTTDVSLPGSHTTG